MTIKELCLNYSFCENCIFTYACPFYNRSALPLCDLDEETNTKLSTAIIETAIMLLEDNDE